jgi:hypothetical protein
MSDISFFFFDGIGVWTQGFALTGQVIYHLSHTSSPFVLAILGIESRFLPGLRSSYFPLLTVAGITISVEIVLQTLFFWLACDPLNLSRLCSLGWGAHQSASKCWDGILWTPCPRWPQTVILPELSLPNSYDYRREPPAPSFKHLFMCLLGIYIFSWEKCLLTQFPHF